MKLNLQFISFPGAKERLVVLPESQFRVLERMASARLSGLSGGAEAAPLPRHLLDSIANGANPVRTIRVWRGLNGRQLAVLAGITPSMLSQIERTGKTGSTKTFKALAGVLGVPLDLIFPSSGPSSGDDQ